ncbi:hypothetical protein TsFJ059_003827 [Trichoderma semiorbis]|uniref:Uncharacterized protein n=1 Tax=Trichoderma semiorbis TaxID=1491008 RepID=A0A9P8KRS8_9HYPO|nr:hypothetical protein TsFJ059_003827 [Trichoderma semiorbis]
MVLEETAPFLSWRHNASFRLASGIYSGSSSSNGKEMLWSLPKLKMKLKPKHLPKHKPRLKLKLWLWPGQKLEHNTPKSLPKIMRRH